MRHACVVITLILSAFCRVSFAYPDFISYGYNTCITCHTNSLGNGPLTQYGRALFSQEIAARPFIPKSVSDEELAEYSSFIPGVQLPSWFQPSVKYRGLSLTRNPGGSREQSVWINMQTDISVVAATSNFKNLITYTYSILPEPVDYYNNGDKVSAVSKEHYLRFYATNQILVAIGLMDKAYGIRTADHTAYNRGTIGMGKDDQADGVIIQYFEKKWDAAINYFVGNLMQKEELRQKGFSGITEFEIAERNRLGFSIADFKTDLASTQLLAIHDRWGLPNTKGASLWIEVGLKKNVNLATDKEQFGNYAVGQLMINLLRGYNFMTSFERMQDINSLNELDRKKWTIGFLTFPFQRIEARVNLTQESGISPYIAADNVWYLSGQVHASF